MSTRAAPPADELHIARGGAVDLDAVTRVMTAAFDDRFGEAWTRSQCAGILPMPGVELVLARDGDGDLAGFSLFRTVADEAELLLLAVAPDHRRRGIGRMLLDQFMDRARNTGASRVHLEVREGNPAVIMYRQAGFNFAGRRPKYYRGRFGGDYDALTLSLKL
jgi:ribosomal-protein-alanine N-acetyltransferase